MPVYQVNMQEVREREDIEDDYIYLERVPYQPKQDGTNLNTSTVKSSPEPPAPSPNVLPSSTANKPSDQATPVTNTSHGSPQQTCLQTAYTSIRNRMTQVFTYQTTMDIFRMMHEVAVKMTKAGRTVCDMRSSSADDAGNTIPGVPSPHKNATSDMDRSSATDTISTSTLQLSSRDENDLVVLTNFPHDLHDENDFVMVDVSPAHANEDDDFIMVDTAPHAEPLPSNQTRLPVRTSARFLVRSLMF